MGLGSGARITASLPPAAPVPGRGGDPTSLDYGGEWRSTEVWPPESGVPTPLFLTAGGALSTAPPTSDAEHTGFVYDPASPVPTVGGSVSAAANIMNPGGFDQRGAPGLFGVCDDDAPLHTRDDVVSWSTPPLASPLTLIGSLSMELW